MIALEDRHGLADIRPTEWVLPDRYNECQTFVTTGAAGVEAGLRNTVQKRNAPASVANAVKIIGCLLWRGLYDGSMFVFIVLLELVVDRRGRRSRDRS